MEKDYLSKQVTDGVKGYLCLCILAHHIQLFSGVFSNTYLGHFLNRLGGWGVAVFFFISGYGLFSSYLTKGNEYTRYFLKKRVLPFYLSYWFFVVIYCVILLENVTLSVIIQSLTFGGTIVSFGWYFQYIGIFYILFFLSFRFFTKKVGIRVLVVVLFVFSVICFFLNLRYMCAIPFLTGFLLAGKKGTLSKCLKKAWPVLMLCSFAFFFGIYLLYIYSFIFGRIAINPYLWEIYSTIGDLAVIVFVLCICYISRNHSLIVNPVSSLLGRYSMEIYACQGIILYYFYFLSEKVGIYILVCICGTLILAFTLSKLKNIFKNALIKNS